MLSDRFRAPTCRLVLAVLLLSLGVPAQVGQAWAQETGLQALLPARVIAIGLQRVGAVTALGGFLGPRRGSRPSAGSAGASSTQSPESRRVLVATASSFGGQRFGPREIEGSILSIDPVGEGPVSVPANLSAPDAIPADPAGRVQHVTVPGWSVAGSDPAPVPPTPAVASISNPLGIAVSDDAGRFWVANAPFGSSGAGTVAEVDPSGGTSAEKSRRIALPAGTIATAVLGGLPDAGGFPILAIVTADGALSQLHPERGVEALAPPGTITPLTLRVADDPAAALVTRAGMVFNWVPDRILYVSDPIRNAVLALKLADDGTRFRVESIRRIEAPEFNAPTDIAPTVSESANPRMAGNTALAGGADFYVLNRGNGVIVRMNQAGQTIAVRQVAVAGEVLGARRLNGIAVSHDAQRIWLTVTGAVPGYPNAPGGLIEVPAFGATRTPPLTQAQRSALVERGAELFQTAFTPDQGLGPLYNGTSCHECHQFPSLGGAGPQGLFVVYRVGRFSNGAYDPLFGAGGPVARLHSIGAGCRLMAGIPTLANLISVRNTPPLFGDGLIDQIPDTAIRARAAAEASGPDAVNGRAHLVRDPAGNERVGRFGWKADTPTLEQFVAEAMRNEMGLTTPLAPQDILTVPPGCGLMAAPKFDGTVTRALTAFVASLPAPKGSKGMNPEGAAAFNSTGCAACHTPSLPSPSGDVPLYSDLLLHDMGPALDDGVVQGQARGRDWRTTPLWGLGSRVRYLHDGRATSLPAAIAAHDGDAARSVTDFRNLPAEQREKLLTFLGSL